MSFVVLLAGMSVIGVDYGWERAPDGEQVYIIQLEPDALEKLKAGEVVSSEILPEVKGVRRFRIQVGTSQLPRGNDTVNVLDDSGVTTPSINEAVTPDEAILEPAESQDDSSDAFQLDDDFDTSGIGGDAEIESEPVGDDDSFDLEAEKVEVPDVNVLRELLNPDEAILANLGGRDSDGLGKFYQGGDDIPLPLSTTELLSKTVSVRSAIIATDSAATDDDFPVIEVSDVEPTVEDDSPDALQVDLSILAEVDDQASVADDPSDSNTDFVIEGSSDQLEAEVLAALEEPQETEEAEASKTEFIGVETSDDTLAATPPVSVEPATTQPWGVLVIVCLLLFGSIGANIYLAYILAGNTRKRQIRTTAE